MRRAFYLVPAAFLASCAIHVSDSARQVTVCVYDELHSVPGVSSVEVYVLDGTPLLSYEFIDDKKQKSAAYFLIQSSQFSNRSQIAGDAVSFGNPVQGHIDLIAGKCRVDVGYLDQVFLTEKSQRVDISRLRN